MPTSWKYQRQPGPWWKLKKKSYKRIQTYLFMHACYLVNGYIEYIHVNGKVLPSKAFYNSERQNKISFDFFSFPILIVLLSCLKTSSFRRWKHLWLQEILVGSVFIFYLTFINLGLEEQPLIIMGALSILWPSALRLAKLSITGWPPWSASIEFATSLQALPFKDYS